MGFVCVVACDVDNEIKIVVLRLIGVNVVILWKEKYKKTNSFKSNIPFFVSIYPKYVILYVFYMFNLKLNEFWRNISIVSVGYVISQLIVIIAIPILSRIYHPENFGLQSIYLSFALILGSLFTLKYELPIVFAKEDKESFSLVILTISFSALFSLVFFTLFLFFGDLIFNYLDLENDLILIFSIFVTTLLIGLLSALLQFNNKKKKFSVSSSSNIIQSVSNALGAILFGVFGVLKYGLIYGYLLSYSFSVIFLFFSNYKTLLFHYKDYANIKNFKSAFKEYVKYPKIILPTTLFSILSAQIIPILLQILYTPTFVGYFAMSNRLSLLPSIVIGGAIGSVLRTEVSILENESKSIRPLFLSLVRKMFVIGIILYSVLGIISPWLFKFALGESWYNAGILNQSVVLYAFSIFMTQCFYDILLVKKQYKVYFYIQLSLFVIIIFSLLLGNYLFNKNPYHTISFMAGCVFIVLMVSLKIIYNFSED